MALAVPSRPETGQQQTDRKQQVLTHGSASPVHGIADALVTKDRDLFFTHRGCPLNGPSGARRERRDLRRLAERARSSGLNGAAVRYEERARAAQGQSRHIREAIESAPGGSDAPASIPEPLRGDRAIGEEELDRG